MKKGIPIGAVVESYEYDASGTELTTSALGNRYLFQGREYDSTTGLYYFRARWYAPGTGRWLSKNPIGINGGLNQYVFSGNNPVMFADPYGESIFAEILGVVSIITAIVALLVPEPASTTWGAISLSAAIHSSFISRAENIIVYPEDPVDPNPNDDGNPEI